jgi:class 3 adenylate cyclase/tetratricopeptide (TPR) repeat protein
MERTVLLRKILDRLEQITKKSEPVTEDKLEDAVFLRLAQAEKIVSSIERYLPRRVIDKILLNPDGSQVEGERRPVTVLFGDLSGFTAMSETLDPEQVVEVVNQYFDTMVEIAERYGGHIDKFMGDALMVLFGAPVAHEDDPLRACLAAIEMLEAMDRFAAERKMELAMSIGLNTGEVVALNVGSKGRMEYTVIGDGVNLAARLEKVATARQCVIGENTYKQVKGKIRLQKLKPVMVKGKSKPQNVYLILGRMEEQEKSAALRSGSIRLVGRMAEMDTIRRAIDEAKGGQGRVVAITGEPGVGKSRLAKELELAVREQSFRFCKGKCYAYSGGMAYLPVIKQLSQLMGIQDKDSEEKKRDSLQAFLPSLDLNDYEPFLGSLLGLNYPEAEELDPEKRKLKTFEAVRELYRRLSQKQPLALAFEDLHWADTLTLELLELLVEDAAGSPMLICCDYRPELALPYIAKKHCRGIELKKLELRETWQMVSALAQVGDVSEEVLNKIAERTEGNPLFIEEIMRSLLSRRLVKRDGEQLVPSKRFGKMVLPNTVASMVLGRIDRLSEDLRHTLQYAAVIGKEFDHQVLSRISRQATEQVLKNLDHLEHFEGLLYSKLLEDRRIYEFHSTTTREAAYSTLLKARRQELHGKVAQTLEREYRSQLYPHYEDIAHHYYHSKDNDKAVYFLHKAGDKARTLYANSEAIDFYQKGLEVIKLLKAGRQPLLETAELLASQGAIFRLIGQGDKALKNFTTAAKIARQENEGLAEGRYSLAAGAVYDMIGQSRQALEIWQGVLERSRSSQDRLNESSALLNLGVLNMKRGDLEQALDDFNSSLAIALALKNDREIAKRYGNIGEAYERKGELPQAIESYEKALELSKSQNFLEGIAKYNNNIGIVFCAMGEFDRALEYFSQAQSMARRTGDRRVEIIAGGNIGNIMAIQGSYQEAYRHFQRTQTIAGELRDPAQQLSMLINIGLIHQIWGDQKAALNNHQQALELAERLGDRLSKLEILRNLGLEALLSGDYGRAWNQFQLAMSLAGELGDARFQAFISAHRAGLLHLCGDLAGAAALAEKSLEEARQLKDPEVILTAARTLVEIRLDQEDLAGAEEHANRALGLAERTRNKREFAYGLLNLAGLLHRKGESGELVGPLSEALTLGQELQDRTLLGRIYLLFTRRAIENRNIKEADDYLRDALETAQKADSPEQLWEVSLLGSMIWKLKENEAESEEALARAQSIIKQLESMAPETHRQGFISGTMRKQAFGQK